jgi:hypothetical protein
MPADTADSADKLISGNQRNQREKFNVCDNARGEVLP